MEQIIRKDPLTGEEFVPKKTSQRFATAANRIKFNNSQAAALNKERAFIDMPCKQSHRILKAIYNPKFDNIHNKHKLEGMGLRYDAFNRIVDSKYGKISAYYDYAIRIIHNTDNVQIIKL